MDYLIDPPEPTKSELQDDVERLEKEVRRLEAQLNAVEQIVINAEDAREAIFDIRSAIGIKLSKVRGNI